jgi:hypothetical protein
MVSAIYPWQRQAEFAKKIDVIAISLDETETEVKAWEKKVQDYPGWKHLRGEEGVRSKVAADYFVLATPVMVLVDAATRNIVATPNTMNDLLKAMQ